MKSRCAREWGGWGRLSDDGPGQNNPDPSEGPWGRWSIPPHGGAQSSPQAELRAVPPMRPRGARRADANRSWPAYAGSRLKLDHHLGRRRLKGQPSSRTGENSPYGMIGGIEETSASFEARSAPRSYPTRQVWLREASPNSPTNPTTGSAGCGARVVNAKRQPKSPRQAPQRTPAVAEASS